MIATAPSAPPNVRIEIGAATLIGAAIGMAIVGFVLSLPLFYFKGDMRWGKLVGASAAVAVFTGLIAYSRAGGKKKCVAVTDEGVQIENEKERLHLLWSEIEGINHWVHGDHYWEFCTPHRARPVVLKSYGFEKKQIEDFSAALQVHKPIKEEPVGMKRMLEDAYIH